MSGATVTTGQNSGIGESGARLDSWKEIAAYLKRSPRTVRRWEREEGLPVHRHLHGKQGTVYAFVREIDIWLKGRRPQESPALVPAPHVQEPLPPPPLAIGHRTSLKRPMVIAILPLRSLSGDPAQQRFVDGLTEELILEVGHCCPNRLRVIAPSSVMHYKGSPKSIGEIGRELGLDYILEGGVRRYGRRVRLTARLIAAHDQGHIWADSFEVQLPPIFSLQQALARQLADSLAAELHITPRKGRRATTSNLAAYHTYTEGRSHFLDTDGDVKKSIEKLSLAIEQDPNFAPGYAQLALEYFRRFFLDYPPIVMMRRVDALASQALKLDPKLVRAQAMLAAYHLFGSRNWRKAEAASRRAIKLNPSFALAWIIRAAYHVVVGELKEAVEELGQAHQINPQSAESNLWIAFVAYFARRYDLAIERGQEILHLDPSRPEIRGVLGLCYAQKGEYSLALSQCEVLKELGKGAFSYSAAACSIYALAGERDSAERLLQELVAAKEQAYMRYIFLAQASASLGQGRQTLEWLEKAYEQRDPLLVFLKADARFDPVSGLPAFRKLLRRLGLAMS